MIALEWKYEKVNRTGRADEGYRAYIPNLVRQYGPSRCWCFLTPKSFPRFLLLLIPTCSYNKIPRRVSRCRFLVYIYIFFFKVFFFLEHYNLLWPKFKDKLQSQDRRMYAYACGSIACLHGGVLSLLLLL